MSTISVQHHRRTHLTSGLIAGVLSLLLLPNPGNAQAAAPVAQQRTLSAASKQATPAKPRVIRTLVGTAVPREGGGGLAGAVSRQQAKYGAMGAIRLFYPGLPSPWSAIDTSVGSTSLSVSFKAEPQRVISGDLDTFFTNWFADAPVERRTFWTYYHEPEDNIQSGSFTAEQYRLAWAHLAELADEAYPGRKLRATLILMCWTLQRGSHRDWRDYYADGSIDLMAWDCYNAAAKVGRYREPARLLDAAIATAKSEGLPWGVAELGSTLATGDDGSKRAAWLAAVSDYAAANSARYVTYFDVNIGVEFRLLDQPSAEAWAAATSS